jgi:hypothetical protein
MTRMEPDIRMEPEIRAVRDLPPGLPEPTTVSVARTWHTIGQRRAARAAPSRRRPLLVPAVSAAVVLAVTIGGAALVGPARPGAPGGASAAPGPDAPSSFDAVMDDLIDRAGRLPAAAPGPDDLVYASVTLVSTSNGVEQTNAWERWSAPAQMMPLRATENGVDVDPAADGRDVDNRTIVGEEGGGTAFPTVQWIAAAPTEPEALLRYLHLPPLPTAPVADRELVVTAYNRVITTVAQLFEHGEPLISTRMRVALYRLVAVLPDMTAQRLTLDGRTVWALTQGATHAYGFALLVDARTGRTVGSRNAWIGSPPGNRSEAQKMKLPDDYQVLKTWRHAIVDSLQDRA